MIINNEDVFRTALKGRPTIKINKKLALQMKWFVEDGGQHYNMKMGPNLTMSLYEGRSSRCAGCHRRRVWSNEFGK